MEPGGKSEGSGEKHCKERNKSSKPLTRKRLFLSRAGKRLFE